MGDGQEGEQQAKVSQDVGDHQNRFREEIFPLFLQQVLGAGDSKPEPLQSEQGKQEVGLMVHHKPEDSLLAFSLLHGEGQDRYVEVGV